MTTTTQKSMNNDNLVKKLNGNGWEMKRTANTVIITKRDIKITFDTEEGVYWSNVRTFDADTKNIIFELCMNFNIK